MSKAGSGFELDFLFYLEVGQPARGCISKAAYHYDCHGATKCFLSGIF